LHNFFFSEPPNYDVALLRATPVRRGELRARLDALADETRLHIIDLLVQRNEMHAQDIIAELGLSQSSVSRHLKQLVSMGYLYERRSEGANKTYRLSAFYFARMARAVEQLLTGEEKRQAHDEDTSQPQALSSCTFITTTFLSLRRLMYPACCNFMMTPSTEIRGLCNN
jgi:DNA-binding transcriptional ArsR family regulator